MLFFLVTDALIKDVPQPLKYVSHILLAVEVLFQFRTYVMTVSNLSISRLTGQLAKNVLRLRQ